ncbi:MAG: hypothetical protein ABR899_00955 [Candidatus Krumholzibacteriaceae bacterium]
MIWLILTAACEEKENVQLRTQLAAAAVTPPAEHAARRPAGAAEAAAADAGVRSSETIWKVSSMIRAVVISCMIAFAAIDAAAAEIVEIPLPGLIGTYGSESPLPMSGCYTTRSASFQLDRMPKTVYAVWIRISGTAVAGQTYCDFSGWPPPGIQLEGMAFSANMLDSLNSSGWNADCATAGESSTFEYKVQFYPHSGATWEYLESGRGDVNLYGAGYSNPFVECYPVTCAVATVTEAVLVIEADFAISTHDESWGAIKSLYR